MNGCAMALGDQGAEFQKLDQVGQLQKIERETRLSMKNEIIDERLGSLVLLPLVLYIQNFRKDTLRIHACVHSVAHRPPRKRLLFPADITLLDRLNGQAGVVALSRHGVTASVLPLISTYL